MAKRFISTQLWEEDWFLDTPNEYKLFWFYMISHCDHSGLFRVNLRSFRTLLGVSVSPQTALEHFNNGKQRIRVVSDSLWLIEDFFAFQYAPSFNINNPVHKGCLTTWEKNGVLFETIRGLKEVNLTTKDKDKDKDKKKGGTGENKPDNIKIGRTEHEAVKNGSGWVFPSIVGKEFNEDFSKVLLLDGEWQDLSPSMQAQARNNHLQPERIWKGKTK